MITLDQYYVKCGEIATKFENLVKEFPEISIDKGEINEDDNTIIYIWYNRDSVDEKIEAEFIAKITQEMPKGVVFDHARIVVKIF